jgi:probable phosphoglycerate mutase
MAAGVVNVFLVRHGSTADVGLRVSGRGAGVHLTDEGKREARAVAAALTDLQVERVYSSPLERARETAAEIAQWIDRPVDIEPLVNEIDFGDWTGRTYDALEDSPAWVAFNTQPEQAVIPHGENLRAVGDRGARAVAAVAAHQPASHAVVVTHGDVIRLTLARLLSMPLDAFRRVAIAPASITCVRMDADRAPVVTLLNHPPDGRLRHAIGAS